MAEAKTHIAGDRLFTIAFQSDILEEESDHLRHCLYCRERFSPFVEDESQTATHCA